VSTIAITEKLLLNAGGWEALKPARDLLQAGRVSEAAYNPPLLSGVVREGGRNYRAGLRITTAVDVENLCTCRESRSWGKICAHSIAVGLAHLAPPPGAIETVTPPSPSAPTKMPQFVSAELPATGKVVLHLILPPNFIAAWDKGRIMLVVEVENGGKRALLSTLPKNAIYSCDQPDLTALEQLTAFPALFASGMLMLTRDEFLSVLPSLRNHPRVTFGKTKRAAISSATCRPELVLRSQGDAKLSARLAVPPDSALLTNGTDAWLLRQHELVQCAEEFPAAARNLLKDTIILAGDRALKFLAIDLPQLRQAFDVRGEADFALPDIAAAVPKFELRLAGSLNQVTADLRCTYAEQPTLCAGTNPEDGFVFRNPENPGQICTRNLPAEKAAIERLVASGFAATDDNRFDLQGSKRVVHFFAVGYPALQREWKVTLTQQVQKWSGEIEQVRPKIEVAGSGEDWFEFRYSLSTPGGQEFSSAEIQSLLRSGQNQTRLRNGQLAVFDPDSLDDFQEVIRDCDPRQTQPGLYRIDRSQAAYLDATLRSSGSTIVDYRDSLRKFVSETRPDESAGLSGIPGLLQTTLRPYQLEGVNWLRRLAAAHLGGILADEMGLGKTVQTLAFLLTKKGEGPALIVCPTSLVANWESETQKFTPELKTLVLEGPNRAARFHEISSADLVITSYALLRRDIDELRSVPFSTAVLDEAQHIKNPDTQNAQAAFAIRAVHRFVLTGTPMENSVRDLWSLMNFSVPGYLGSRTDFRERYEQPLARGPEPDLQRRLSRRLQPFLLRRRKRDVAKDLPEKIEQVIPCDLTSTQRSAYDALLREIQQDLQSERERANAGTVRMKLLTGLLRLRQVCCDLRLLGLKKTEGDTSAKLDLLDELLEQSIDGEHRVLVFSQFVSMLGLIRERLEKLEIPFCYLDGRTRQRQEVVNRFQSDAAIAVFLISLKAGGVGLNLSAADTVIHFDPWWNPAVEAQATDRAHRIGQTRIVTSYKLIARDTVEEKILRLQEKKRAAIDAAIESEEPLMTGLTTGELEELLS